ncbi:hypothetical protein GUITHDRAFT_165923 [Guillardia theta CCMP2712]|uniref:Protein-S-isoprenylcysteine O-methyltransferase n=1 Tax=Guillardia theta (strain CCMP2712) TaxID=905079 RepID=L1IIK4_GUITC|nr:hypothetical protein GUITHDRAFT_165923 [Guillardia theta CCMP2712]EKX35645.1 hypothetical protein GUITHDRAFT_165923 [Guillardia theta CCMP2712]|eukprot:XP_005822625.1 hypothetical protein GUITHDRAFT_165923 [Guillardia theta CCMP2712]
MLGRVMWGWGVMAGMYGCVHMIGSTLAQRGILTSSSSSSSSSSATPQKRTASSGHSGKAGEEAVHTPIIFLTPWIKVPLKAPGMLFASYLASAATKALAYPQTSPISKLLGVGESVVLAAGVGLFSISAYLYYSSVKYMVDVGTPVPYGFQVKTLCTNGPFRYFKHPIYTALFGCCLATPLVLDCSWCFISPALFWAYVFWFVVPREEKYMKDKFGKEYENFSTGSQQSLSSFNGLRIRCA